MCIVYSTSKVDRAHNRSLIDRGANRGVAGEYSRVLFTHPDRRVDIRGTDNHEITSIPIVTTGGFTRTTTYDVIMVLHQCAYYSKGTTFHSTG